jgi:hypothetical protein
MKDENIKLKTAGAGSVRRLVGPVCENLTSLPEPQVQSAPRPGEESVARPDTLGTGAFFARLQKQKGNADDLSQLSGIEAMVRVLLLQAGQQLESLRELQRLVALASNRLTSNRLNDKADRPVPGAGGERKKDL